MNRARLARYCWFPLGLLILSCGRPEVPADWSAKKIGEELNAALDKGDMARAEQLVDAGLRLKLAEKPTEEELKLNFKEAIEKNRFARVHQLLKIGADPNKPFIQRYPGLDVSSTPLSLASVSVPMTELLLRNGADIEQIVNSEVGTPIIYALSTGRKRTALWLLHRKANPNALSPSGRTALHQAIPVGTEVTAILLDKGLDIEARTPKLPDPPKSLENQNWDPISEWHSEGATPLLLAAGNPELVDLLVKRGAKLNAVDDDGAGLLHYATDRGSAHSIKHALGLGFDPNAAMNNGLTPLHLAAASPGWFESDEIELLLKAGAKRDARDAQGRTPVDRFRPYFAERLRGLMLTKDGIGRARGQEIARGNKILQLLEPGAKPINAPIPEEKNRWLIYEPIQLWNPSEFGPSPIIRREITFENQKTILKLAVSSSWKGPAIEIKDLWAMGHGSKDPSFTLRSGESREFAFPSEVYYLGGALRFDWKIGGNKGRFYDRYAYLPMVTSILKGDRIYGRCDDPFGRPVHFRVVKLVRNDKEVAPEQKEGLLSDLGVFVRHVDETGTVELETWLGEEREAQKVKAETGELIRWSSANPFLPAR